LPSSLCITHLGLRDSSIFSLEAGYQALIPLAVIFHPLFS
jgi:hypothetical protein